MANLPFVMVIWNDAWKDATTDSTFEDADDVHNPVVCYTVGWLLRDNLKGVLVANEYSPDGTYRGKTMIPRGMVVEVIPHNLTRKRVKHVPDAPSSSTV